MRRAAPAIGWAGVVCGALAVVTALVAAPAPWLYPAGVAVLAVGLLAITWSRTSQASRALVVTAVVLAVGAVSIWWPGRDLAVLDASDVSSEAVVLAQRGGLTYLKDGGELVVLREDGRADSRVTLPSRPMAGPRSSIALTDDWIVLADGEREVAVLTSSGEPAWEREVSRGSQEVVAADASAVVLLRCDGRCTVEAVGGDGQTTWSTPLPRDGATSGWYVPYDGRDEQLGRLLPDQVWLEGPGGRSRSYTMAGELATTEAAGSRALPAPGVGAPTVVLQRRADGSCLVRGVRDGVDLWSTAAPHDACGDPLVPTSSSLVRLAGGAVTVDRETGSTSSLPLRSDEVRVSGTGSATVVVEDSRAWVLDARTGDVLRTLRATSRGDVRALAGATDLAASTLVRSINPYVARTRAAGDDGDLLRTGVRRLTFGEDDDTGCLLPEDRSIVAVLGPSTALLRDGAESSDPEGGSSVDARLQVARCPS